MNHNHNCRACPHAAACLAGVVRGLLFCRHCDKVELWCDLSGVPFAGPDTCPSAQRLQRGYPNLFTCLAEPCRKKEKDRFVAAMKQMEKQRIR